MNWLFTSGGQSMGASASAAVLPVNIQGWFLFILTGLISLLSKGLSRVFSNTTAPKHLFFSAQPCLWSNSHIYPWLLRNFVVNEMSLLFSTLSRFVIAFLSRSKRLLIAWLQLPSAVILEPKEIKSVTASTYSHSICLKWWTRCHDLRFLNVEF